jgi:S-adenosylmethionine-diacylglycerol 3-amino-3-carboxypropyl transferase
VRTRLPDAQGGALVFAQVREDPALELAALRPGPDDHVVCVSSAGCTALSLLAAGAGRVTAVDLNPAQNHLVELKAAACARLGPEEATALLGGAPMDPVVRQAAAQLLLPALTPEARAFWTGRPRALARGVLTAGRSEGFVRLIAAALRAFVHSRRRALRLLACQSLAEQRAFFASTWDTRRWRGLFHLLLNRAVMSRAYHPAFFAHAERMSFAEHFLALFRRTLTELPVSQNYFVHQMLTGRYPEGALPPYLAAAGSAALREGPARLHLVDGTVEAALSRMAPHSVNAFALSNIAEWSDEGGVQRLFEAVLRAAAPGARVVFRNFTGWTEVPAALRGRLVEDRALGERLILGDRSGVQRRIAVCRVVAPGVAA